MSQLAKVHHGLHPADVEGLLQRLRPSAPRALAALRRDGGDEYGMGFWLCTLEQEFKRAKTEVAYTPRLVRRLGERCLRIAARLQRLCRNGLVANEVGCRDRYVSLADELQRGRQASTVFGDSLPLSEQVIAALVAFGDQCMKPRDPLTRATLAHETLEVLTAFGQQCLERAERFDGKRPGSVAAVLNALLVCTCAQTGDPHYEDIDEILAALEIRVGHGRTCTRQWAHHHRGSELPGTVVLVPGSDGADERHRRLEQLAKVIGAVVAEQSASPSGRPWSRRPYRRRNSSRA